MLGRLSMADVAPHVWPLASVVCLLGAAGIFAGTVGSGHIDLFARFTAWAVAFTALTWTFAAMTLVGVWRVWVLPNGPTRRAARIHASLVTAANLTAVVYLAYWGIIGLRLWP